MPNLCFAVSGARYRVRHGEECLLRLGRSTWTVLEYLPGLLRRCGSGRCFDLVLLSSIFVSCAGACVVSQKNSDMCVSVCLCQGRNVKLRIFPFFFLMVWLKSFTSCASWGAITRLRFFFLLHTRRFCAHMKRGARAHGSWARSSIVAKARSTSPTHILTEHRHFARDERYHHILVVPSCATFLSSFFFFFIVLHGRIWWINAIGNCRRA